jgi:hypothetical protein
MSTSPEEVIMLGCLIERTDDFVHRSVSQAEPCSEIPQSIATMHHPGLSQRRPGETHHLIVIQNLTGTRRLPVPIPDEATTQVVES